MDRTARIAVAVCVIGLVLWEVYVAKQMQPRPAPIVQSSPTPTVSPQAAPSVTASPSVSPAPAETVAEFAEKIETLRNSDIELELTNRGGGIKQVVLLNHVAEKGRVILNNPESVPVGVIMDQPIAPALAEFAATRNADGAIQYEAVTPDQIKFRKKFAFAKATEGKDNFVVEMDVDVENGGQNPYSNRGYFVALS